MKMRKYLMLIAALTVSSAFFLGGCSLDLPGKGNDTAISSESENLTEGNVQLHSRWYNHQNAKLASATITLYDGDQQIFQGTTDANGTLLIPEIPANKEIKYSITDAAGTVVGESSVIYKISADYTSLSIIPASEKEAIEEVDVPTERLNISAAIFVTEDKTVSHANLAPYTEESAAQDNSTAQDGDAAQQAPTDAQTPGDAQAPTPDAENTQQTE